MAPDAQRLFRRFREAEVAQAQKVWLRALHLRGRDGLARAYRAQLFVKLWANRILPAFAESGKDRHSMNAVFAAQHRQGCSVLVIRVRGDAHHRQRVRQIEQRLVDGRVAGLIIAVRRSRSSSLLPARGGRGKERDAKRKDEKGSQQAKPPIML